MVRLTDRPDMTLDVYRGRKTTIQPIIVEPPGAEGRKICSNRSGHKTNIHDKNLKNSSSLEPVDQLPLNLIYSIWY